MDDFHYTQAQTQLKTRDLWLNGRKLCEYELLQGIEQKLYGHLVYLQEAIPKPDLTDAENRVLNLCISAFSPQFRADPAVFVAAALEAGVSEWLDDLQIAMDITSPQTWQGVIKALAEEDLGEVAHFQLLNRYIGTPPIEAVSPSSVGWFDMVPGQIRYLVTHRAIKLENILPEARDSLHETDRQEDLLWLVVRLLVEGRRQSAVELIDAWTTANPDSLSAWCAAAVSGDPSVTVSLQQAVTDERIPALWLVVHGAVEHIEFCITLLEQPRFNELAERAWYGFTGERLPRVPAITLGDNSKGKRLADAFTARQWFQQHRPQGRQCLGQAFQNGEIRFPLCRFFGKDAWPITMATWVETNSRTLLEPNECHWQRAQRLREAVI